MDVLNQHPHILPGEKGPTPSDVVKEESTGAAAAMFAENDSLSSRVTPRFLAVQVGSTTVLSFSLEQPKLSLVQVALALTTSPR